ncbi:MAG: SdiA-regulated domain-containing protein [Bacteroidota bacterium]
MKEKVLSLFCFLILSTLYVQAQNTFNYELDHPNKTIELPSNLREISGISLCERQEYIWAVQDEEGMIFQINIETGVLMDSIVFWKSGDYEGIEIVGKSIYVLKSSGTVYQVEMKEGALKVEKFNDYLSKEDNTEGLGYNKMKNKLLVACKNGAEDERMIYSFDVETKALDSVYYMRIDKKHILEYLRAHPELRKQKKLIQKFEGNDFEFAPSAVAIHPLNEQVYVLSSVGKTLFVLDHQGNVLHIEKLDKAIHAQPEGICFDFKGNLFIANEGKKGAGKIYRFDVIQE